MAAMRGADQPIRSSLGFRILPEDTSTCRAGESNQQPSDNKMLTPTLIMYLWLFLLHWEFSVLLWHVNVQLWMFFVLTDLNCVLHAVTCAAVAGIPIRESTTSQTEGQTRTVSLWEISLLMFFTPSVAFLGCCGGRRWVAVFPLVSRPSLSLSHTFDEYVVAGSELLVAHRKTQHSGPTLYVKGRSSFPGEQERLEWGGAGKHTLTSF